jgi:ParB-like chromosome segregation protein Spo0J
MWAWKRDDRFVPIDGRHRYEAHRRLKKAKIGAFVCKLPELERQSD